MSNLLIEIGTEELPLGSLDVIDSELSRKVEAGFKASRILFESVAVETTPRRIVILVKGMSPRQEDQDLEFSGPSVEQAYDTSGHPTRALEGFLKSKGVSLSDIQIRELPRGKFVFVKKKEAGKPSAQIIPGLMTEALAGLPFPKLMRWESSGFRFPRPIRWVAALLDKKILPFSFAGLRAGAVSCGHRFLSPKPFKILSADFSAYKKLLKSHHVILNAGERTALIRSKLETVYAQKSIDEDLLHTVSQLVEEPFLLEGTFSKDYLDLPSEVLATCMKKHQKIFACYDAKGKLTNRFVAVLNGKRGNLARIRADFENVLESRLKDARYFYAEDTKTPLVDKVAKLDEMNYLGKLGTLKGHQDRMVSCVHAFCEQIQRPDLKEDLEKAAHLCKADLVTHLVYEMPELQGIAGREYALKSGENQKVAEAIGTQYSPKNLAEDYRAIPEQMSLLGAMLGILDRMDLLVGAFIQGLEPSGSQDPFALRRAGGVVVKLVRAFEIPLSLSVLIRGFLEFVGKDADPGKKDMVSNRLKDFFKERTLYELGVNPGSRSYEIAQAVFKSSFDNLSDVFVRYETLTRLFEKEPDVFAGAVKVLERTANITKNAKDVGGVKEEFLREVPEQKVYRIYQDKKAVIEKAVDGKKYEEATRLYAQAFAEPIHEFFEKVLVNAEDAEVRRNRLALLKNLHGLYASRVADLSLLSRID